jgi:hypothetical protein
MRGQYLISIALYLTYLGLLLYLTLFVFPEASKMLREREAFADLLLDEEFSVNASDVVFKKTFGDVMTTQVRTRKPRNLFCKPILLYSKTIVILPRQARDKHREGTSHSKRERDAVAYFAYRSSGSGAMARS